MSTTRVRDIGAFPFGLTPSVQPARFTLDARPVVVIAEPPPTTTTTTTAPRPKPRPKPVGDGKNDTNKADTRAKPKASGLPLGSPFVGAYAGPEIEGFARYDAQTTCDPTPKPGTIALRDLLLSRYPNTSSLGISRACDVGGQSEHKEGRAFDWGANVTNPSQAAAVNDFLAALFATDAAGHRYALARRMGVMYVIWNQQIWGAYDADSGWRPYEGDNPHTDHVHISLSWAGARGETSFWSGTVVTGLPDGTHTTVTRGPRTPRSTTTTSQSSTTTRPSRFHPPTSTTSSTVPSSTSTSTTSSIPTTTTSTTAP